MQLIATVHICQKEETDYNIESARQQEVRKNACYILHGQTVGWNLYFEGWIGKFNIQTSSRERLRNSRLFRSTSQGS